MGQVNISHLHVMPSRFICSKIFLLLVAYRISSVFIVQTTNVPDEYWQSVEVAHKLAFDYGHLTWEWRVGIRSYLYPFLISVVYSILKFFSVDYTVLIITLPRIFQALLTAYADYKFYLWTGSKFALFNLCISWYWYYCATRTLINSFETCLTIIALADYPWRDNQGKNTKFLWIVAFLCFARPTAAVFWLPLCLYHLFKNKSTIIKYLLIGLITFAISTIVDTICYGNFILTPYEFFKVNVLNKVSELYGIHHPLWYLFAGLPVILGLNYTLLPFVVHKIHKTKNYSREIILLAITIVWSTLVYSVLAHKEFRFLLPITPMIIYIIDKSHFIQRLSESKKKLLFALLIVTNVLPSIYFNFMHHQGALRVMRFLKTEIQTRNEPNVDILFLTSCHATPFYSHLHENVSMRFLTCEPNLSGNKNYMDEADTFFMKPIKWLENNYLNNTSVRLPTYVVTFDTKVDGLEPFLKFYKEVVRFLHRNFDGNLNEFLIFKRVN